MKNRTGGISDKFHYTGADRGFGQLHGDMYGAEANDAGSGDREAIPPRDIYIGYGAPTIGSGQGSRPSGDATHGTR